MRKPRPRTVQTLRRLQQDLHDRAEENARQTGVRSTIAYRQWRLWIGALEDAINVLQEADVPDEVVIGREVKFGSRCGHCDRPIASGVCTCEHERLCEAVQKFLEVYAPEEWGDMPTSLQKLTEKLVEDKHGR